MGTISKFLIGWKGYVAAAGVAAVFAASTAVWATSTIYGARIANLNASIATEHANNAEASLAQFTSDAGKIHDAAIQFGGIKNDLNVSLTKLSKDFANVSSSHPLDPKCRPTADRLRILSLAVAAANAAAFGQ